LRSQAHPLYQPVLDKYIDAVAWLYRGSVVRFRRGLRRAEAMRAMAEKQSRGVTAYLDQTERIYSPDEQSKQLADCFQTLDQLQKLEGGRHSPISDYLDKFDR
jgi:hypothetical protein